MPIQPLLNGLPLDAFPGNPWSSSAPQTTLELITTYNLVEQDMLTRPPTQDLAWATMGTMTSPGTGIIKVPTVIPQRTYFTPFKPGGDRDYQNVDVVATEIRPGPYDLNFWIPMIWDEIGNGWMLKSMAPDGSLLEFVGMGALASTYVTAGLHHRAQLVASLTYKGLYMSSINLTSPTARCFPEPNNPNGIALFTDGTGADGSGGAPHYANPTVSASGRFSNVFPSFGAFASNYGASLAQMAVVPHATLPNVTFGAHVTDTVGPTYMRNRFWEMAVSSLVMQTATAGGGTLAAAAPTNAYSDAISRLAQAGITQENFLGVAFGPRRFWVAPQLDNHPYYTYNSGQHMTDGPNGGPADMWFNLCAAPDKPTWAKLGCNNVNFAPRYFMYGPGDPLAMSQRMMRFEGDLDAGVSAGAWQCAQMFFGV